MKRTYALSSILVIAVCAFSGNYGHDDRQFLLGMLLGGDSVYPNQNRIPDGQSGITSLAVGQDGNVYGSTSAMEKKSPYLFQFKKKSNLVVSVKALDSKIKGQVRTNNTLCSGGDGYIYGGTSNYEDKVWQRLDERLDARYEGGRLFRFKEGGAFEIEDLGLVLAKEGVRTMTADPSRGKIYGLTEPSYRFFVYDIKLKKINLRTEVDLLAEKDHSYQNRLQVRLGKAMITGKDGRVWGSAYESRLFCYDPQKDKLEITDITFPSALGHEDINAVSAFCMAPDGVLYGGTSTDGMLFRFDPKLKRVWNLGKPGTATNIRSLVMTNKGDVVGVLGQNGIPAYLFRYSDGSFENIGLVRTHVFRADYNFYASELEPSVYLKEGVILFGNSGRIGRLLEYYNQN